MSARGRGGPLFDLVVGELDALSTVATDEVVVVVGRAASSIDRLAVVAT
jgi:hypothetical protein